MPFSRRLSCLKPSSAPYFLLPFLPTFASAKHHGSLIDIRSPSYFGGSVDDGGSSFNLEPVDALIFAISIIFCIITALQLLAAGFNIPKHASHSSLPFCSSKVVPTPFALPTPINANPIPLYALGPIFPVAFFFAILCLLATYILRAVFWAIMYNQNHINTFDIDSENVITAWTVFSYLRDAFLTMSLFSFVCFRVRRLCYCTCRGKFHLIKRVFDMVLVFTLFLMGTAYVGYRAYVISTAKALSDDEAWFLKLQEKHISKIVQLRRANEVLLVFAAVEVFISAIMLYKHAEKYQSPPDRKVAILIGTIIAPFFLAYALYPLISQEVLIVKQNRSGPSMISTGAICQVIDGGLLSSKMLGFCSPSSLIGLDLGRVIVTCVPLSIIIWMLLRLSGASFVDALKGRSSSNAPQEHVAGQVYVHTHGLTYKL